MRLLMQILLVCAISCIHFLPSYAQIETCIDYHEFGGVIGIEQCPGPVFALARQNNYIFAACGEGGLWVMDATNSARPTPITTLPLPGSAQDIQIINNCAYLACESAGLQVVDISQPQTPVLVGNLDVEQSVDGLECAGDRLYLYGSDHAYHNRSALHVINITTPHAPELLGIQEFSNSIADLAIGDGLACTSNNSWYEEQLGPGWYEYQCNSIFSIIDLSSDETPVEIIGVAGPNRGSATCVEIIDDYVYLYDQYGLQIFSIADPAEPFLVGTVDLEGYQLAEDMHQIDNLLYISKFGRLIVLDTSDPTAPTIVCEINIFARAKDIEFVGRHVYLACAEGGIRTALVEKPSAPVIPPSISELAISHIPAVQASAMATSENLVFACDTDFSIIDISDPLSPQLLGSIPTAFESSRFIRFDGDLVYLDGNSTPETDIAIIDISDPTSPTLVSYLNARTEYTSPFAVENGILYRAMGFKVEIYDVTVPSAPVALESIEPGVMVSGVAVQNGILYVSGTSTLYRNRMFVIDVTDPAYPDLLNTIISPAWSEITFAGNRAYIGGEIVDMSNPEMPVHINYDYPISSYSGLGISGDLAYAAYPSYLNIYDISNESRPTFTSFLPWTINRMVTIPGGLVVVNDDGLFVLPLDCQDTVPTFLTSFIVTPGLDGIHINWNVSGDLVPLELRLVAENFGTQREIPIQQIGHGSFFSLDNYASTNETITYRLYLQEGQDWFELSSQVYSGQIPAYQTRILGAQPNPFNPQVNVFFETARNQVVQLYVHDLQGRLVAKLASRRFNKGQNEVSWDGRDIAGRSVSSGAYFVVMTSDSARDVCKVMLVR